MNVLLDADIILLTADMKVGLWVFNSCLMIVGSHLFCMQRRLEVSYGRARVVRASLRTLNHSSLAFEAGWYSMRAGLRILSGTPLWLPLQIQPHW